jgi:hypothetical protein
LVSRIRSCDVRFVSFLRVALKTHVDLDQHECNTGLFAARSPCSFITLRSKTHGRSIDHHFYKRLIALVGGFGYMVYQEARRAPPDGRRVRVSEKAKKRQRVKDQKRAAQGKRS